MKTNYIPGLSYRFYPGTLRNYEASGLSKSTTTNYKLALFTGDMPTNETILNTTNYETFKANNIANLVLEDVGVFSVTFNNNKLSRIYQRSPIDSVSYNVLCDKVEQGEMVEIQSKKSLYALIYLPDKDVSLNTSDNDLLFFTSDVDNSTKSFVSVSHTEFVTDDQIYLRNVNFSLFQGYTNTDENIIQSVEDPENPGTMIDVNVGTLKSIYMNKVWLTKLQEAYRDMIIPKYTSGDLLVGTRYSSATEAAVYFRGLKDKFGVDNGSYSSDHPNNFVWKHAYLVNESFITIINQLNTISSYGLMPKIEKLCKLFNPDGNYLGNFVSSAGTEPYYLPAYKNYTLAVIYSMLLNPLTNYNAASWLINEAGIDAAVVEKALNCTIPLIDMNKDNYSVNFDQDTQLLAIQYTKPIKLGTKYKEAVHNIAGEQLYIFIPRSHKFDNSFGAARWNGYVGKYNAAGALVENIYTNYASETSRNFSLCMDVTDSATVYQLDDASLEHRFSIIDYTAISIGLSGNGQTDLEFDILDNVDYIDSFTALIQIPNSY